MNSQKSFHKLLVDAALNWYIVGASVWILPLSAFYRTHIAGFGMILGIVLGWALAKFWTPDPRLLGVPYLKKLEDVLNDKMHQPLMTLLYSQRKTIWPVLIISLAIAIILTIGRSFYPQINISADDRLIIIVATGIASLLATCAFSLAFFYHSVGRRVDQ